MFWAVALRLPAMDDRIVAWKLCHVLHKVLREGHPYCLENSQRHVRDLDEIGKLWVSKYVCEMFIGSLNKQILGSLKRKLWKNDTIIYKIAHDKTRLP